MFNFCSINYISYLLLCNKYSPKFSSLKQAYIFPRGFWDQKSVWFRWVVLAQSLSWDSTWWPELPSAKGFNGTEETTSRLFHSHLAVGTGLGQEASGNFSVLTSRWWAVSGRESSKGTRQDGYTCYDPAQNFSWLLKHSIS